MSGFLPQKAARWGWFLVIWGAPWSHAAMSVGTVWVGVCAALAWSRNFESFRFEPKGVLRSPLFWLLTLMLWQCLSLVWSHDAAHGVHILSIQASLVVLAAAWHAVPLPDSLSARTWLFRSVSVALVGVLLWGVWREWQGASLNPRDWTPWMSHIRLSMLAALVGAWGIGDQPRGQSFGFFLLWGAFIAATGALTSVLFFPLALAWGWNTKATQARKKQVQMSLLALGIAAGGALTWWLQPVPLPAADSELPLSTALGNPYTHQPHRVLSEGGYRVHLFVCEQEWPEAWAQVSEQPLNETNSKGFRLRDRLLRYLTSKGWPKDGEHILKLTPEDVKAIESGATNVYPVQGIRKRIRETRREWEVWRDQGDASGHALFQRFDHWSAGMHALLRAPWFGHGVGDTALALSKSYDLQGSPLKSQHRHRAHMQHLTWAISGGLVAWLIWLAFWWTWWSRLGSQSRYALWGGIVVALSCLFEDTWETQAGVVVSFLALFSAMSDIRST